MLVWQENDSTTESMAETTKEWKALNKTSSFVTSKAPTQE
jgi:hypothetical protein